MTIDAAHSRPRHSILSLFDPLSSTPDPTTPPRNDSPSSDSDKENENPPRNELTLTTFFNRTYKPHPLTLKPLRRRLVDVGDVTVDDVDLSPLGDQSDEQSPNISFEDNENDTLTFRQMADAATPKWDANKAPSKFSTPSPSAPKVPRTPLAELSFDQDTTPVAKSRVCRSQAFPALSKLAQVGSPQIIVSSADSPPRAAANLKDHPAHVLELHTLSSPSPSENDQDGKGTVGISIPPNPLVNSVSSVNIPSAAGSLIADAVIPTIFTPSISLSDEPFITSSMLDAARLRPNLSSSCASDQSRLSVDLHASFQLHMSGDATFDLLNDKISFFESKSGLGSYLEDDPSFDMSFGESDAVEPRAEEEAQTTQPQPVLPSPVLEEQPKVQPPVQSSDIVLRDVTSDVNRSPDVSKTDRRQSLETVTPKHSKAAPVNPPPVVGLRIIKRSQLKTATATSSPKVAPSPKIQPVKKTSLEPVARTSREPPQSRRSSLQNSAAPLGLNRGGGNGVLKTNPVPARASATASSRTIGARRVLVTDEPEKKATRPSSGVLGGGSVASLQGGPRRVPISERPSIPRSSGSSIKQPSLTSTIPKSQSNRTNIGSSLPQPVARATRLPAPSVVVRPTGIPARESRGIPIRRVI